MVKKAKTEHLQNINLLGITDKIIWTIVSPFLDNKVKTIIKLI